MSYDTAIIQRQKNSGLSTRKNVYFSFSDQESEEMKGFHARIINVNDNFKFISTPSANVVSHHNRLINYFAYHSCDLTGLNDVVVKLTGTSHHNDLEAVFNSLASQLYKETRMFSFIKHKAFHVCYQNIIGMGEDALPFIFKELSKGKGDWIYAIERILRVNENTNPVPQNTPFKETNEIWLRWGYDHGYVS
jgi:hypothetical protein